MHMFEENAEYIHMYNVNVNFLNYIEKLTFKYVSISRKSYTNDSRVLTTSLVVCKTTKEKTPIQIEYDTNYVYIGFFQFGLCTISVA